MVRTVRLIYLVCLVLSLLGCNRNPERDLRTTETLPTSGLSYTLPLVAESVSVGTVNRVGDVEKLEGRVSVSPGNTALAVTKPTVQTAAQPTVVADVSPPSSYEPPDPNTEPVIADLALDTGVSFAGGEVVFDAYSSQGTDLTYNWSFGDGEAATGPYAVHSYAASGEYSVGLTIANSVGRSSTVTEKLAVLPEIGDVLPQGGGRRAIEVGGSGTGVKSAGSVIVTFDVDDLPD